MEKTWKQEDEDKTKRRRKRKGLGRERGGERISKKQTAKGVGGGDNGLREEEGRWE